MDRQSRVRVSGLVFLLVLAFQILSTKEGSLFLDSLTSQDLTVSMAQVVVGAALVIFASESVGYILSSLTVFIFNRRNGYSGQYRRTLAYSHFPEVIRKEYEQSRTIANDEPVHYTFERRWPGYTPEQLLVYFFWHRPEAENRLEPWVERRNTAYFTALSTCLAILLATVVAAVWAFASGFQLGSWNLAILAISLILAAILARNGVDAMRDGLAAIDLVLAGHLNPSVSEVFRRYTPIRLSGSQQRPPNSLMKPTRTTRA